MATTRNTKQSTSASSKFNVLMEGTPLMDTGAFSTPTVMAPSRMSRSKQSTAVNRDSKFPLRQISWDDQDEIGGKSSTSAQKPKPAILPKSGTVGNVPVQERKKPQEKITTLKKDRRSKIGGELGDKNYQSAKSVKTTVESVGDEQQQQQREDEEADQTVPSVTHLVSEALELSKKVDDQIQSHYKNQANGGGKMMKQRAMKQKMKQATKQEFADLYEDEQTKLVDSLIMRLKQSATGELVSDSDLKIRDVTRQIADSLGVEPEECNFFYSLHSSIFAYFSLLLLFLLLSFLHASFFFFNTFNINFCT